LVSTSGVLDVPVKLFNQQVGVANHEGKLLVTGLRAYQLNGIATDSKQLLVGLVAADLAHDAEPEACSGRFRARTIRSASADQKW
jgi:outer membrane usher protein FimD/PapC